MSLIVCWLSRCGQARPSGRFSLAQAVSCSPPRARPITYQPTCTDSAATPLTILTGLYIVFVYVFNTLGHVHRQGQCARTYRSWSTINSNQLIAAQAREAKVVRNTNAGILLYKSQYNVTAFHHSCQADTLSTTSPSSSTPQPSETKTWILEEKDFQRCSRRSANL